MKIERRPHIPSTQRTERPHAPPPNQPMQFTVGKPGMPSRDLFSHRVLLTHIAAVVVRITGGPNPTTSGARTQGSNRKHRNSFVHFPMQ